MLNIKENISLADYTTFKTGGTAKYFFEADSIESLKEILIWAKNNSCDFFVLGGGSNVLISDSGFNGVVIRISHFWKGQGLKIDDSAIIVDAGILLSKILLVAKENCLSGLEWAVGIPGTIGGATRGNSGAFGKGTGDFVESVDAFNASTMEILKFKKSDCGFEYRGSIFRKNKNLIILNVSLSLKKENKDKIQSLIKEYLMDRVKKNSALLGKSAGCYFKNILWENVNKEYLIKKFPELSSQAEKSKLSTGFLIDSVGLKGKEIGGACVPNEHANYIINKNNAKSEDVVRLSNLIREKIFEKYGIKLEEEVELVGF